MLNKKPFPYPRCFHVGILCVCVCVFMLMGMHTGVVVCDKAPSCSHSWKPPRALGEHLQPLAFPYAPRLLSLTQSLIQRDYELTSRHHSWPRQIGPDLFSLLFFNHYYFFYYYYDFSIKRELLIM